MQEFLIDHYLWIKSFHLIAVIAWMAGIFYLPRLFVYHADTKTGSKQSETFKLMEQRLYKIIMNPAMILTWIFAGLMIYANNGLFSQGWFHAKLLLVILMTGYHHVLLKWMKNFANDNNEKSAKYYRIANEIPTLLMVIVVILAIVKPF